MLDMTFEVASVAYFIDEVAYKVSGLIVGLLPTPPRILAVGSY
jgi:hypothetical protein